MPVCKLRKSKFGLAGLVAAMVLLAGGAQADQEHPRLPELFEQLASATATAQAMAVEQQIWRLWLEVEEGAPRDLLEAGMTAMSAGEIDAAIGEFDSLVAVAPTFAEGWNKRATALYLAQRYPESVRDIQRTLELEPRHFGALSGMGLVFLRQGDLGGALRAFEAVLKVHPLSPSARQNVEHLRRELGTSA